MYSKRPIFIENYSQNFIKAFIKAFIVLVLFCFTHTSTHAHIAGVTDTAIHVANNNIDIIYTVPTDNFEEFTKKERANLEQTIVNGFKIKNQIKKSDDDTGFKTESCASQLVQKKTLSAIQSQQFLINYRCKSKWDKLLIDYLLFLPKYENHENFVRLSLAGHAQSFTFSSDKVQHEVPIAGILKVWRKSLPDQNNIRLLNYPKSSENIENTNNEDRSNARTDTPILKLILQSKHYFGIGVEHIILGFDHVLFLIALLLLPLGLRSIIAIATSFTLAHSITLAISVLGLFTLPAPYVEAAIALSIVYIAIENVLILRKDESNDAASSFRRVIITFCFGLLHGFGFSYVLKEIGLGDHIVGSLLFFNLGVEAGQLLIVILFFPLMSFIFKKSWGKKLAIASSTLVGLMGIFWLSERILSLI